MSQTITTPAEFRIYFHELVKPTHPTYRLYPRLNWRTKNTSSAWKRHGSEHFQTWAKSRLWKEIRVMLFYRIKGPSKFKIRTCYHLRYVPYLYDLHTGDGYELGPNSAFYFIGQISATRKIPRARRGEKDRLSIVIMNFSVPQAQKMYFELPEILDQSVTSHDRQCPVFYPGHVNTTIHMIYDPNLGIDRQLNIVTRITETSERFVRPFTPPYLRHNNFITCQDKRYELGYEIPQLNASELHEGATLQLSVVEHYYQKATGQLVADQSNICFQIILHVDRLNPHNPSGSSYQLIGHIVQAILPPFKTDVSPDFLPLEPTESLEALFASQNYLQIETDEDWGQITYLLGRNTPQFGSYPYRIRPIASSRVER